MENNEDLVGKELKMVTAIITIDQSDQSYYYKYLGEEDVC